MKISLKNFLILISFTFTIVSAFYGSILLSVIILIAGGGVSYLAFLEEKESDYRRNELMKDVSELKKDLSLNKSNAKLTKTQEEAKKRLLELSNHDLNALTTEGRALVEFHRGRFNAIIGDWDSAIAHYNKATRYSEAFTSKTNIAEMQYYIFNNLGWLERNRNNYQKALEYFTKAENLVDKSNVLRLAEARYEKAIFLHEIGKSDQSLNVYKTLIVLYDNLKMWDKQAAVMLSESCVYRDQGKVKDSYHVLTQANNLCQNHLKEISTVTVAEIKSELGNALLSLFREKNDFTFLSTAYDYMDEALKVFKSTGELNLLGGSHGRMGLIKMAQGNADAAYDHHKRAYDIFVESKNIRGQANELCNIGIVYRHRSDFNKAVEFVERAIIMHRRNYKFGLAVSLETLAKINLENGNKPSAIKYFKEAMDVYKSIGNSQYIKINDWISRNENL